MASLRGGVKRNTTHKQEKHKVKSLVGSAILLLLLGGCTTWIMPSFKGAPDRLFSVTTETDIARSLSGHEWLEEYAKSSGQRRRELRDQVILSRMYAADVFYSEYEANLTRERQNVGFWSTVASLALTGSATALASKEVKTVLSAVATGLTGVKDSYDKDILIEKTITILQSQMRARRKEIKVIILNRLGSSPQEYPVELALTDVEAYYRAGTITGAFIDVAQEAGVRLSTAREDERNVIVTRFAPVTNLGTRIRAFARTNITAVTAYLAQNHPGTALAEFIRLGSRADQLKMIQTLRIP